jgi:hypothetical protein
MECPTVCVRFGDMRSESPATFHLSDELAGAIAQIGLHDVRSYRITVNGETRHHVVALDEIGEFRSATAWSPAAAVGLLLSALVVDPAGEPAVAQAA